MSWCCATCDHLDKSRINRSEKSQCYQYGCSKRGADKYICFWLSDDKELKTGGCSDYRETQPLEQLSLF
jgi:hypothetical protein